MGSITDESSGGFVLGVELQAEEMFVHITGSSGLHQDHFLS